MSSIFMILSAILLTSLGVSTEPETKNVLTSNPIFSQSEELVYKVSWMGITAGSITMRLENNPDKTSPDLLRGVVIGKTSSTFSFFFKVRDTFISVFDRKTLLPVEYSKNIREGRYRKDLTIKYDHENNSARSKAKTYPILPMSRDPISCIYKIRDVPLYVGEVIQLNADSHGTNYPIQIKVTEREYVKFRHGGKYAFKCEPLPTWEGRVFEKKKSKVVLWLSDDEYRVPLKIYSKVRIGTIKAKLVSRKGPGWEVREDAD